MDNLVLLAVARELALELPGTILEDLRQESGTRFRLRFASPARTTFVVLSMRPELPWVGVSSRRWEGPRWSPDPFTGQAAKALTGARVAGVRKLPSDRVLVLEFSDGHGLVAELATHGANLVLIGPEARVQGILRRTRSTELRLVSGEP